MGNLVFANFLRNMSALSARCLSESSEGRALVTGHPKSFPTSSARTPNLLCWRGPRSIYRRGLRAIFSTARGGQWDLHFMTSIRCTRHWPRCSAMTSAGSALCCVFSTTRSAVTFGKWNMPPLPANGPKCANLPTGRRGAAVSSEKIAPRMRWKPSSAPRLENHPGMRWPELFGAPTVRSSPCSIAPRRIPMSALKGAWIDPGSYGSPRGMTRESRLLRHRVARIANKDGGRRAGDTARHPWP